MKKGFLYLSVAVLGALLLGCKGSRDAGKTFGKNVLPDDLAEFVYTYENINYNAFFLRYRFYAEDGKLIFSYEKRERPGDYGPATEEDVTASGSFELSDGEKEEFFGAIDGGRVTKRKVSAESGDPGPWTFIYTKDDPSVSREYSFPSAAALKSFEDLCSSLAEKNKD